MQVLGSCPQAAGHVCLGVVYEGEGEGEGGRRQLPLPHECPRGHMGIVGMNV